ncbi:MAG TPA: proline--tRNA ligase [Deltaproteobacteria bacterium]|nr:proline--tRNA ligase [Deltaproteobacteria bacterium]
MKQSQMLIPTLREAPADAEVVSHKLMLRAGMIRKSAAGIYTFLPLALRVLGKIERIIREEMERDGAQEVLLPIVMPAELWKETGRWDYYGKELLRFKDRGDREFCLGPTHEEAITDLVRQNVNSYRQLPLNLFQIQTKFRDEIRPRFGLMRGREFLMKDGYSFHVDEEDAKKTYWLMYEAYQRIFQRCGLVFRPVEAMTGAIGGSLSHEFQVLAKSGEDPVLTCSSCDYAANVEKAALRPLPEAAEEKPQSGRFQKVATPGVTSVEEVARFLQVKPEQLAKILIYETEKGPVAALIRGDRELVPAKLQFVSGANRLEMASNKTIEDELKSSVGFTGPVGLKIPLYVDYEIAALRDFVTGANERDYHLKGVNLGDFAVTAFADLRRVQAGDACPNCETGKYEEHRGIEVGQVFFLGTKYSQAMQAKFLDAQGQERIMVMGCYGIGVSRSAAAAIEQNHDENGIIWPYPLAPFHFHLLSLNINDAAVQETSRELYQKLTEQGLEVLWDDRDESPGVKFKDSDLLGIPYRIVVGAKGLKEGLFEMKSRKTGEVQKIPPKDLLQQVLQIHVREQK